MSERNSDDQKIYPCIFISPESASQLFLLVDIVIGYFLQIYFTLTMHKGEEIYAS